MYNMPVRFWTVNYANPGQLRHLNLQIMASVETCMRASIQAPQTGLVSRSIYLDCNGARVSGY